LPTDGKAVSSVPALNRTEDESKLYFFEEEDDMKKAKRTEDESNLYFFDNEDDVKSPRGLRIKLVNIYIYIFA